MCVVANFYGAGGTGNSFIGTVQLCAYPEMAHTYAVILFFFFSALNFKHV